MHNFDLKTLNNSGHDSKLEVGQSDINNTNGISNINVGVSNNDGFESTTDIGLQNLKVTNVKVIDSSGFKSTIDAGTHSDQLNVGEYDMSGFKNTDNFGNKNGSTDVHIKALNANGMGNHADFWLI